jgi:hypothetical protein
MMSWRFSPASTLSLVITFGKQTSSGAIHWSRIGPRKQCSDFVAALGMHLDSRFEAVLVLKPVKKQFNKWNFPSYER